MHVRGIAIMYYVCGIYGQFHQLSLQSRSYHFNHVFLCVWIIYRDTDTTYYMT